MQVTIEERQNMSSQRRELVTVTVAEEDFRRLKASESLLADQLGMALRRYLHIIQNAAGRVQMNRHGWARGPVVSFPCAISKTLTDEIRNLGGRFDSHTIEAVGLFFGKVNASSSNPQENHSRPKLHRNLISLALGALSPLVSRIFGY
jgi:hypothetical protein